MSLVLRRIIDLSLEYGLPYFCRQKNKLIPMPHFTLINNILSGQISRVQILKAMACQRMQKSVPIFVTLKKAEKFAKF